MLMLSGQRLSGALDCLGCGQADAACLTAESSAECARNSFTFATDDVACRLLARGVECTRRF